MYLLRDAAGGKMNIVLYSSPTCPKCKVLKAKLAQAKIDYDDVEDIAYMTSIGIRSIPRLKAGGAMLDFTAAIAWVNAQIKQKGKVEDSANN
jgi:predicted DsbA family dithiol-disulfide isomerase